MPHTRVANTRLCFFSIWEKETGEILNENGITTGCVTDMKLTEELLASCTEVTAI